MPSENVPSPEQLGHELKTLARAIGHPTRSRILQGFHSDRQELRSPSHEARKLALSLGTVSYHFRVLADLGILEVRQRGQVRGAVVHYYGLSPTGLDLLERFASDFWPHTY